MKLKLPGNTTGYIGPILFENGVSVGLVSPRQANQFRAIMTGVTIVQDDGVTPDDALNAIFPVQPLGAYIDMGIDPPSIYLTDWQGQYPEGYGPPREQPVQEQEPEQPPAPPEPEPEVPKWTRQELEAIADKEGIAGLREISERHGIKGRAIVELIDAILAANLPK